MTRRRLALIVMPLIAIGAAVTSAAVAPERLSPVAAAQVEAKEWARAHHTSLPTEFASFAGQSLFHRKAVYRELAVRQQGNLWREHWETFVKADSQLSPLQRKMVRDVGGPLSPDQIALGRRAIGDVSQIFDSAATLSQRQEIMHVICDSAKVLFSKGQASLIFGTLGPEDSTYAAVYRTASRTRLLNVAGFGGELIALVHVVGRKSHLLKPAATPGYCSCNWNSLCSCGDYQCLIGGCPIDKTLEGSGCGCAWLWECNADCTYI